MCFGCKLRAVDAFTPPASQRVGARQNQHRLRDRRAKVDFTGTCFARFWGSCFDCKRCAAEAFSPLASQTVGTQQNQHRHRDCTAEIDFKGTYFPNSEIRVFIADALRSRCVYAICHPENGLG